MMVSTGGGKSGFRRIDPLLKCLLEDPLAKLKTDSGRKLYAARKHIVKPVFGQIKHVRGFRQFLRRGLECVSAECSCSV
jgi:hypothetical protein